MRPRIGGAVSLSSLIILETWSLSDTSQARTITRTPFSFKARAAALDDSCDRPLLFRNTNVRAPFSAIQIDVARPIPPNPPTSTYDVLGRKREEGSFGVSVFEGQRIIYLCGNKNTLTTSFSPIVTRIDCTRGSDSRASSPSARLDTLYLGGSGIS